MKNPEQMLKQARRVMLNAALGMTRLRRPMRRAVRLVLLQGKRPSEAARKLGMDRRYVHRALLTARARLAQVEEEVARRVDGGRPG